MVREENIKDNLKDTYIRVSRPVIRYSGDDIKEYHRERVQGVADAVKAVYGKDEGVELLNRWRDEAEEQYSR